MEIIKGKDAIEFLKLSSVTTKEAVSYFRNRVELTILWVDFLNCSREKIQELLNNTDIKSIKAVHFASDSEMLIQFEELTHWNYLSFGYPNSKFDFTYQGLLEGVGGVWSKKWLGLESCENINSFMVSGYKKTFIEIPNLQNLKNISLIQPDILNLEGLDRAKNLQTFELISAKKLTDISAFSKLKSTISKLCIEDCKNITSFVQIKNLTNLECLLILNCNSIDSLFFVKSLIRLNFLSVNRTKIADGECPNYKDFINLKFLSFNGTVILDSRRV
jgi:hypothetical protein